MYHLEIQGLLRDFCHNSRPFQGFIQIQGLFKTSSQIQGLFSILYKPCATFHSQTQDPKPGVTFTAMFLCPN